jgi:hypothetical protein
MAEPTEARLAPLFLKQLSGIFVWIALPVPLAKTPTKAMEDQVELRSAQDFDQGRITQCPLWASEQLNCS